MMETSIFAVFPAIHQHIKIPETNIGMQEDTSRSQV